MLFQTSTCTEKMAAMKWPVYLPREKSGKIYPRLLVKEISARIIEQINLGSFYVTMFNFPFFN